MTIDDHFAMPTCIGLHGTIALAGEYSNPTPPNSNDPGLDSQNGVTKKMKSHHVLLIVLGLIAIVFGLWYFGFFESVGEA